MTRARVATRQGSFLVRRSALYGRAFVDKRSKQVSTTNLPASKITDIPNSSAAVGKNFLPKLPDHDADAPMLLSTLLDDKGSRKGVLAQLMHTPKSERPLDAGSIYSQKTKREELRVNDVHGQQAKQGPNPKYANQIDLFQRFAELLPNGLAILDSDAHAVFVNDGFFRLTTDRDEKNFRAWPESIDSRDYDRVMTAYRDAFISRKELRVEFRCTTTHEKEKWRLFLLRPLKEEADTGFICAVVDITEIKLAEISQEKAANEASERRTQQERFIDMVSHEIRNPLSAVLHLTDEIRTATRSLREKFEDEMLFEISDAAETILLCVHHQNVLVDDILSFSKLDAMMLSLSPSIVQPKLEFSLALKVFQSELRSKGIQFHYALDVSYEELNVDYVMADINKIKQVLINLVTNAIKFTAKKQGTRHISVAIGATSQRPTSYPPNVVFFESKENQFHYDSTLTTEWGQGHAMYLMVAIKDTGIGISLDDQAKLFERFRQATPRTQEKYGGSGLGLFISRKICQLHGGDIGVSSKEGVGSTFGFFFKVRRADAPDAERPSLSRQGSSQSTFRLSSISPSQPRIDGQDPDSKGLGTRSDRPNPSLQHGADVSIATTCEMDSKANSDLRTSTSQIDRSSHVQNMEPRQTLSGYCATSHGANVPSLDDPPVEFRDEAHPSSSMDDRFNETAKIAQKIPENQSSVLHNVSKSMSKSLVKGHGETERQASKSDKTSERQQHTRTGDSGDELSTILLVEDNLINQKVLRRQLQARNFQVSVANNGQEAIDAFKQKVEEFDTQDHSRSGFDCILMDQEMPLKDGNAATQEIREFEEERGAAHGLILGVTANVREAQRDSMLEAGMDDVINKPYKVDELVKHIRKRLLVS